MKMTTSKRGGEAGSDSRMDELINACNNSVLKSEAKYRLGYNLSRSFLSRVVPCEQRLSDGPIPFPRMST
jgi:hypothetical protein